MPEAMGHSEDVLEEGEDLLTRRAFVRVLAGVVGAGYAGAIGYPIYRYLATPATRASAMGAVTMVALPGAQELAPGSALMFRFGTRTSMLIRHADDTWVAFDAVCTHLGCTVQYEPDKERIYCACHGGVYDQHSGAAVAGPPPRGLTVYNVEVRDAEVIISRV